jgi:4-nitrophenyl phosphatase
MDFTMIKAIISDMDGVLWHGDMPLPGLREFFDWLHDSQMPYVLATNNSSKSQQDYVEKLARLGVPDIAPEHIVTSGTCTADYLRKHYPAGTAVHVFGSAALCGMIRDAGFRLTDDGDARAVVAGIKWDLSYEDLKRAAALIRAGADFIGTNPDTTYPMPDGPAPGTGSMLAALQAATGREPLIIGKPYPHMFKTALDVLGTPPESTLMIGDRLNTDIVGAAQLGLRTALVLSGISAADDLAHSVVQPDVVLPDLPALLEALAGR